VPEPPAQSADVDLDACLAGDAAAWQALVKGTTGLVIAAIRRTVGGSPPVGLDIEDLVQNVYVKLLQHDRRLLRRFDPARAALSTWITLVARSTTIDALRRRRLPTVTVEAALLVPTEDVAPEVRESAVAALPAGLLTDRQTTILRLLYDDDLNVADVARVLGVEAQTIRSARHKAMERLRRHFSTKTDDVEQATKG
jgi:RNA polymerase sigma-70 factor (ECF subfamily)